jgi:signal transduction histidine kinase
MWTPLRRFTGGRRRGLAAEYRYESLSRAVAVASRLAEVRLALAGALADAGRAEAGAILEYDELGGGYIELTPAGRGKSAFLFRADGTLLHWLRTNRRPMGVPDPGGAHLFLNEAEQAQCQRHHVRAFVPLMAGRRLTGVAAIMSARPRRGFTRGELSFLETCGRHAGLALEAAGRRERELERLRAVHQSEKLAVAGRLAAAVAHEVRNPLAAIRSMFQSARTADGSPEARLALLDDALGQVDRIDETVEGILRLSRPDRPERVQLDLVRVVEDALASLDQHRAAANVTVVRNLDARPLEVLGDRAALRGVFDNLFLNACQAMDGGGKLAVRSALVSRQTVDSVVRMAQIEVGDTGPGMPPEVLERAFDPFFTTKARGTGLGLAIGLETIQRHGGEFTFESEPGRGTVATVLIPLRPVS